MNTLKKYIPTTAFLSLLLLSACNERGEIMKMPPSEAPEAIFRPQAQNANLQTSTGSIDVIPATAVSIDDEDDGELHANNTVVDPNAYFHYCLNSDTLKSIADLYQVDLKRLASLNGLRTSSQLSKNKIILLPRNFDNIESIPGIEVYTVIAGDSYARIAKKINISLDALMKLNSANSSSLQIGDTIYIPAK